MAHKSTWDHEDSPWHNENVSGKAIIVQKVREASH